MPFRVRSISNLSVAGLAAVVAILFASSAMALSLEDLERDPKLTPQRFASYFKDFKYQFHADVQEPEIFLATRSGDCDDYATLAASVLSKKGYTTRLITVRTQREVHVVCYVREINAYLDYNNRDCWVKTVASNGSMTDVASKVAKSFDSTWSSASEFTFSDGLKRLVETVVNPATVAKSRELARVDRAE